MPIPRSYKQEQASSRQGFISLLLSQRRGILCMLTIATRDLVFLPTPAWRL
jgi:hypothetical protein